MSEIEVKLNKPQASFLMMPHKFRAFVAGYGCVHPDTRIWTEHGLMRISEISSPTRVLSFDEKNHKLLFSLSGGSFPKGKANLYRVSTSQGEFLASGHHHVFSSDYRYVRVDSLREGQEVFSICKDHLLTTMESVQKSYLLDAPHLTEKCVDLMGRYADEARLYGQQFLSAKDNGQVFFQEQGDVQELSSMACSDVALHMDGLEEQKQEHNHHE